MKNIKFKHNNVLSLKSWIIFIVIELILVSVFFVALYDTRLFDQTNTYTVTGTMDNIDVRDYPGHLAFAYITINDETYRLTWIVPNKREGINALVNADEKIFSFTIQKHRDIGYIGREKQIVDIRSENKIYYDINDHNSESRSTRIMVCIAFSLLLFSVTFIWMYFVKLMLPKKKGEMKKVTIFGK